MAVPTGAVAVQGDRAMVTVFDGGKTSEVTVQTGAVGEVWTEITDGLEVGQAVVLADLDAPLPTSATGDHRSSDAAAIRCSCSTYASNGQSRITTRRR